ncbi:hypothetical protein IAE33_004339 [Pseudomonas sp. S60]|uniref:hypothetical protein n=1 Tax=Pseudomonas sp. S60 TaxID=211124 RepID=UPI0019147FC2|nr:hypothetical protein [Pseudomonas sp. S60]MBK5012479.1 hypothetical protein [Pseudomonas sp. S60]
MVSWSRSTPWRQGYIVDSETLAQLGIIIDCDGQQKVIAVVATHDCDLAQVAAGEPEVELILGTILAEKLDGNYTHCKTARRLHLELTGTDQRLLCEFDASKRVRIPKEHQDPSKAFISYEPARTFLMSGQERSIFQRWLAARYRRSSFPDEFDRRLRDTKVAERLAKLFKDTGNHIPAVFFDVDQGMERARDGSDDLYELSILVLYKTDEDPEIAEEAAQAAVKAIEELFESRCRTGEGKTWKWIELIEIDVISDEALTYSQSLNLTRWQADYVSLRSDPEQPILDD